MMKMIYKYRKQIAIPMLAIIILFSPEKSEATIAAVVAMSASLLGAVIVGTASCTYYKPSTDIIPRVAVDGTITRCLVAAWYAINGYGQSSWWGKQTAAKITKDKVKQVTDANPSKYPKLKSACTTTKTAANSTTVGDVFSAMGYKWKVAQVVAAGGYNGNPLSIPADYMSGGVHHHFFASGSVVMDAMSNMTNDAVTVRTATNEEFAQKIANKTAVNAPENVYSDYYGEIDDFIKDNPNVIEFVDTNNPDDTEAPPFIPPVGASSQPASNTTVSGLGQNEATRAASSASTAKTALVNAIGDRIAAENALAADPTNTALQDALNAAKTAEAAAQKTYDAAQEWADTKAKEAEEAYTDVGQDSLKSLNFDKWKTLKGCMENVWPFSLLLTLASKYSAFVSNDHIAPVFTIALPLGKSLTVDMSPYNSIAQMMRYALSGVMVIGVVWGIVRFYRGVV